MTRPYRNDARGGRGRGLRGGRGGGGRGGHRDTTNVFNNNPAPQNFHAYNNPLDRSAGPSSGISWASVASGVDPNALPPSFMSNTTSGSDASASHDGSNTTTRRDFSQQSTSAGSAAGPSRSGSEQRVPAPGEAAQKVTDLINDLKAMKISRNPGSVPSMMHTTARKNIMLTLKSAPRKMREGFSEFLALPQELQMIVWEHAANESRLIEIERAPLARYANFNHAAHLICGSHALHQVARKSCKPPAIAHACRLSREIAKRAYKRRTFDTVNPVSGSQINIYYNPGVDILYFGPNTCVSTMMHVFNASPAREEIPRVAVHASGSLEHCQHNLCDWADPNGLPGVVDGVHVMDALHGIDRSRTDDIAIWNGCPGLREVFFVTPSHLWDPRPTRGNPRDAGVDPRICGFREPSTNGITGGQIRFKQVVEQQIRKINSNVNWLTSYPNLWTGNNKPTFKFVSLAGPPIPKGLNQPGVVYNAMAAHSPEDHAWLQGHFKGKKFVEELKRKTNCRITLSETDFPGEKREIGFEGSQEAVDAAKQLLVAKVRQRRLASQPSDRA